MVKYTVAASVGLIQLAVFTWTSVALPIEYPEGLESRAILNPNDQQFTERDNMELEARISKKKVVLLTAAVATTGRVAYEHTHQDNQQAYNQQAQTQQAQNQQAQSSFKLSPGSEPKSPPVENSRRDLSDLDSRDWKEFVKRYIDELDGRDLGTEMQNVGGKLHAIYDIIYSGPAATAPPPPPPPQDPASQNRRMNMRSLKNVIGTSLRSDDYEMEARGLDADELD